MDYYYNGLFTGRPTPIALTFIHLYNSGIWLIAKHVSLHNLKFHQTKLDVLCECYLEMITGEGVRIIPWHF